MIPVSVAALSSRKAARVGSALAGVVLAATLACGPDPVRDELAPGIVELALPVGAAAQAASGERAAGAGKGADERPVPAWIQDILEERRESALALRALAQTDGEATEKAAQEALQAILGLGDAAWTAYKLGRTPTFEMGAKMVVQAYLAFTDVQGALAATESAFKAESRHAEKARAHAALDCWSDEAGYRSILAALSTGPEAPAALAVELGKIQEESASDEQVGAIDRLWWLIRAWQEGLEDLSGPVESRSWFEEFLQDLRELTIEMKARALWEVRSFLEAWAREIGHPAGSSWPRPGGAPRVAKFFDRIPVLLRRDQPLDDVFVLLRLVYEGERCRYALYRAESLGNDRALEILVPALDVLLSVDVLVRSDEGWARLEARRLDAEQPYVRWLVDRFDATVTGCRLGDSSDEAGGLLAALERIQPRAPLRAEQRAALTAARRCQTAVGESVATLAERAQLPAPAHRALQARIEAAEQAVAGCSACSLGALEEPLRAARAWLERDRAFRNAADAALERVGQLTSLASAFTAWKRVSEPYSELGQPISEQSARFEQVTQVLADAAERGFDAGLRGDELRGELEGLEAWIRATDCARLAELARGVHAGLVRALLVELDSPTPLDVAGLSPALRTAAWIAERRTCGQPEPALLRELVSACAAAVRARAPASPSAEQALRWLLALDRVAQELAEGAVLWAILEAPVELYAVIEAALEGGDTAHKDVTAYAALATLPSEQGFERLSPKLLELVLPLEERIRRDASGGRELAELSRAWIRIERLVRAVPTRSLLDGREPGRVLGWTSELLATLDQAILELTSADIREIEAFLEARAWQPAETRSRELSKRALPGSRVFWIAQALLGRSILGDGARLDLEPAIHLFQEVVQGTEGEVDSGPDSPRSRAACGWARACVLQAQAALAQARDAIARDDWRSLRTAESSFVKAVAGAEKALLIALTCGSSAVSEGARADLASSCAAWNAVVAPRLTGRR